MILYLKKSPRVRKDQGLSLCIIPHQLNNNSLIISVLTPDNMPLSGYFFPYFFSMRPRPVSSHSADTPKSVIRYDSHASFSISRLGSFFS